MFVKGRELMLVVGLVVASLLAGCGQPNGTREPASITPKATGTPTPYMDVWVNYANSVFGISLEYPSDWEPVPGFAGTDNNPLKYAAVNGFFHVNAVDALTIDNAATAEAGHRLQPYGSQPTVESLQIQGEEARLILPADDEPAGMDHQAALIVRYPRPRNIGGSTVRFFVLWADVAHIRTLAHTLRFSP